ncbi:hypothetical protein JCM11251_000624 [Rhodosporidiobolus azoricus]
MVRSDPFLLSSPAVLAGKAGLSLDEKRSRMLESDVQKEFHKLQDIEKLAPKVKGITAMSVKEVLQSLVDDNLVKFEKIGSFYWSFPSDLAATSRNKADTLSKSVTSLRAQLAHEQQQGGEEEAAREETDDRQALITRYEAAQAHIKALESELDSLTTPDEVRVAEMKQELLEKLKASALLSTDNISAFLSWQIAQGGAEAAAGFRAEHGIDDQFEDLVL